MRHCDGRLFDGSACNNDLYDCPGCGVSGCFGDGCKTKILTRNRKRSESLSIRKHIFRTRCKSGGGRAFWLRRSRYARLLFADAKMCATAGEWNFGLCATRSREPRQARKGATVPGSPRVPQITRSSSH